MTTELNGKKIKESLLKIDGNDDGLIKVDIPEPEPGFRLVLIFNPKPNVIEIVQAAKEYETE